MRAGNHTVTPISSFIAVAFIRVTILCHYRGVEDGKQKREQHFDSDFVPIQKYRHLCNWNVLNDGMCAIMCSVPRFSSFSDLVSLFVVHVVDGWEGIVTVC